MTIEELLALIKAEGYESLEAMIAALKKLKTDLATATTKSTSADAELTALRGSVQNKTQDVANAEARAVLAEQESARLKAELETVKGIKASPEPKPGQSLEKSLEEQIAELEGRITDEQWDHLDALLEEMSDEDTLRVAGRTEERRDLLKGILSDPKFLSIERPATLRPEAPKPEAGSIYERYSKKPPVRRGGVPVAPSPRRPNRRIQDPVKDGGSWINN